MRKHVLFLVHGMGAYVNPSGTPIHSWSKAALKALKEQYNHYAILKTNGQEVRQCQRTL